jgi:hypothetical protein
MAAIPEHIGFQGRGSIRTAPRSQPENLLRLGNANNLQFDIAVTEVTQQDYESESGGELDSQTTVSSVTANITMMSINSETLARMFRGSGIDAATLAQTDEEHTAYVGALCLLNYNPDKTATLTVTQDAPAHAVSTAYSVGAIVQPATANDHIYLCTVAGTSDSTAPTWPTNGATVSDNDITWLDLGDFSAIALDTDYTISRSGLVFLDNAKWEHITTSTTGLPIKVTYTPLGQGKMIEALMNSGIEYKLVFDGMNFSGNNRPCTVIAHRVKFSPTASAGFINPDNFAEFSLTAKVLRDSSITGSTLSKFFQVRWHDPE